MNHLVGAWEALGQPRGMPRLRLRTHPPILPFWHSLSRSTTFDPQGGRAAAGCPPPHHERYSRFPGWGAGSGAAACWRAHVWGLRNVHGFTWGQHSHTLGVQTGDGCAGPFTAQKCAPAARHSNPRHNDSIVHVTSAPKRPGPGPKNGGGMVFARGEFGDKGDADVLCCEVDNHYVEF